jgi:two-component system response regulator VicR
MSDSRTRVLVADDEERFVRAIKFNLEASGYEVVTARNGQMAVELAAQEEPDLILLDIKMPRLDGYAACRRIREFSRVPIIMLTARTEEADKIQGLDSGADDYVTKPFSAEELLARVRAGLRRGSYSQDDGKQPVIQVGELQIDLLRQRVSVAGKEVDLTPTEYRLLAELGQNAGRVMPPEHLLNKVWGPGYAGETRLVWQAIHRVRQKVERDPEQPEYILTRTRIGYYLIGPGEHDGKS